MTPREKADAAGHGNSSGPAASEEAGAHSSFPHLVVRIMSGVYQREPLLFLRGPEQAEIAHRYSFVRHPQPFLDDGRVSPGCREQLIRHVQEAVTRTGHRMCVVWAGNDCTFVERDSVNHSETPPSGGIGLPAGILFDQPGEPLEGDASGRRVKLFAGTESVRAVSAAHQVIEVILEPDGSRDDDYEGVVYVLEMRPGQKWSVWRDNGDTREPTEVMDMSPVQAFECLMNMPIDFGVYELKQQGILEEVAYHDWDSGGPGAGAGRVSVYRFGNREVGCMYFGVHDAGYTEGCEALDAACEAAAIEVVTDATVEVWRKDKERMNKG